MKAVINIDPESTAYIFANAFFFGSWFADAKICTRGAQGKRTKKLLNATTFKSHNHENISKWVALGGSVKIRAQVEDAEEGTFKWVIVNCHDFENAYALYLQSRDSGQQGELLEGSADQIACDSWLQYAVYGKLVYG